MPLRLPRKIFSLVAWVGLMCTSLGLWAQESEGNVAKGIAIIRSRTGEDDEFAKAVLFTRMEGYAVVTKIFNRNPNALIVENGNIAATLTFDDLYTRDLLDDTDKALLLQKEAGLVAMSKRFPKSAPVVKPVLEAVQLYLKNLEDGQVRWRGGWTGKTAYLAMLKLEQLKREADKKKIREEQEEREKTMAALKAADDKARMAAEQRLRDEEEARKAAERQAAVMAMQKAADQERMKQEEAADIARREANLKAHPNGFAARHLLESFATIEKVMSLLREAGTKTAEWKVPESWGAAMALLLPRMEGRDVGLRDGAANTSTAVLFVHDGEVLDAASFCVPLKMEEDKVVNPEELRSFQQLITNVDPDFAQWLPFGLASVRTKHRLHGVDDAGLTSISRTMAGRGLQLTLTEPRLHDDGGFYAYLTLTLR